MDLVGVRKTQHFGLSRGLFADLPLSRPHLYSPPPPAHGGFAQPGGFAPTPHAPGMQQLNRGMANMSMQPPAPGAGFGPPPPGHSQP
jgi:hypothetical protein